MVAVTWCNGVVMTEGKDLPSQISTWPGLLRRELRQGILVVWFEMMFRNRIRVQAKFLANMLWTFLTLGRFFLSEDSLKIIEGFSCFTCLDLDTSCPSLCFYLSFDRIALWFLLCFVRNIRWHFCNAEGLVPTAWTLWWGDERVGRCLAELGRALLSLAVGCNDCNVPRCATTPALISSCPTLISFIVESLIIDSSCFFLRSSDLSACGDMLHLSQEV